MGGRRVACAGFVVKPADVLVLPKIEADKGTEVEEIDGNF